MELKVRAVEAVEEKSIQEVENNCLNSTNKSLVKRL
jgi:hypothetical protein